ncbi:fumarylacetoacetate hydrolase family protein [Parerythrobacter aestuarii]|uniref:fumarylacetoacetate hydrolase family protein n=1 Tax=Parerythrobacter aestuarii TaxID=3020909 RepID=UPI0024DEB3BE|nr:fumarylacetoacetate hydrolase family protein [Parerythrobacter aestuarii]
MAGRMAKGLAGLLALGVVIVFGLWVTSPDPRGNPASFEEAPLEPALASLDEAVTLAQVVRADGSVATLLVTGFDVTQVQVVDLSRATGSASSDPFAVLAAVAADRLEDLAGGATETLAIADLLPAGGTGERHLATGTNFPEHAEEASSGAVFQFPKFGQPSAARTTVEGRDDVLLDYEVELCMRFDRPVVSLADFDAAVKGLFLCGDFTDRAALIRLVDPDNLDSGRGFSDGKSRHDFYPTGPFLVVPRDWSAFVAKERMMTLVNGEPRQDARGGEMTLDFRALAEKALGDMERPRFLYQGEYHRLSREPRILADMTLMSGTAEGVIFTPPSRGDMIEGGVAYLLSGAWLSGADPVASIIETFIANELESGHFLHSGDAVEFRSSGLGTIRVDVIEGPVGAPIGSGVEPSR